jgi:hypothetical protein
MQSSSNFYLKRNLPAKGNGGPARYTIKPAVSHAADIPQSKTLMNTSQAFPEKLDVCVVIPTYKRAEGLRVAIESLFGQSIMAQGIRVLVVDNNALPVEKTAVAVLSAKFNHPIEYIHEPNAGVSNARNAAMKTATSSRFIAFLDDDMIVSPDWLSSLLATSKALKAGLVFGPTYAVMPNVDDPGNMYMEPFFERRLTMENDGYIEETLGTGGCLIDLEHCQLPTPPFNPAYNQIGGEDDIFFDHLKQTGTRVVWSAKATSYEMVPVSRVTPGYIWKRNFGYGQGPARIHASRGASGVPKILYFMMTGTIQFLCYAPILAFQTAAGRPARSKYLALTARALGKIFWQNRFTPHLYGKAIG